MWKKHLKINKKNSNPANTLDIPIKRTLHYKILFVILPLFLISFAFFGVTAYFSINNGITNITKEFIGYKLKEVSDFAISQSISVNSSEATKKIHIQTLLSYAQKFTDESFLIIPYELPTTTEDFTYSLSSNLDFSDIQQLHTLMTIQEQNLLTNPESYNSWLELTTSDHEEIVGVFIPYTLTQSWLILLANRQQFYAPIKEIIVYLLTIVSISLVILIFITLIFVNRVISPLNICVNTIKSITDSLDFGKRIKILYPDEIGVLGQYFNNMIQELEKSYNKIRNFAYQTVLAKQKEERIRFIFQKYVPKDVIDHVLNRSTDDMLVGQKQRVSLLFSDIRDFTTISEQLPPETLVISLNSYFTSMVQQIIQNKGMIDKFIGDAIMAIFGAPAYSKTSADDAIKSAILMIQELKTFNKKQKEYDQIQFEIGIGINTGVAIVGNIGSDQKLDYTVIGDAVNLGARLEGLTKFYKQPILISEFTKKDIIDPSPYFFLNVDTVRVKGKKAPVTIYTPLLKKDISSEYIKIYQQFHYAQQHYYQGDFEKALTILKALKSFEINLYLITLYIERCEKFIQDPPKNWEGIEDWKTK